MGGELGYQAREGAGIGQGAGDGDNVEGTSVDVAGETVANADLQPARVAVAQILFRQFRQLGLDLQADHGAAQMVETGGDIAAAGTDLQDAVIRADAQGLEQVGDHLGGEHGLALAQGDLDIGVSQTAIGVGDEALARDGGQGLQHPCVVDAPGADLLLDHVEAGGLEAGVHRGSCLDMNGLRGWVRRGETGSGRVILIANLCSV